MTSWPPAKTGVEPLVRPYFTFKDELSVADGIVYKGQQAVIPRSMRPACLQKYTKHTLERVHAFEEQRCPSSGLA